MRVFKREVRWCGRIISKSGVKHDPDRITALMELPEPMTAKELQQFVCAVNWMRLSFPAYNSIVTPLMKCMEEAYRIAGARTTFKVAKVPLSEVGWGDAERESLGKCKLVLKTLWN